MKDPRSFESLKLSRRKMLGLMSAASVALSHPRATWAMFAEKAGWAAKQGPLMTQWSAKVDAKHPLPEYPRPQMVRSEWMNLNGVWEFQAGGEKDAAPFGKALSGSILVPFCPESSLSGVMEHYDRCWYRRMIDVPKAWKGKRVMLHFGAVDWESEVFVNGKSVGLHRGGYVPFSYDITDHLKGAGDELVVRVFDPTETGGQPRGKQNTHPRGITYTPTTGIWQTVWLEPVSSVAIKDMRIVPDVARSLVEITVETTQPGTAIEVEVTSADRKSVAKVMGEAGKTITVPVPNARMWSPDDPYLYTLDVRLKQGAKTVDAVGSYFAMRRVTVSDAEGQKKLLLNGKFVFQLGPLDQGFWPDGIYTAPTDDALRSDIENMKAMGFNMVRKHIKVEPARWYYWADKLGLLVWQDMPSCNSYPGKAFVPPPVDKAAFERELREMVLALKNVPSIALWVVFNEGQGQHDTEKLVNIVRELDPSRPINEASGGQIMGFGDLNDIHSYPEPAVRPSNGRQAMVCGEFGGIGYLIPEHSWQKDGRSYIEVDTADDLLYTYAEYIAWVKKLRDHDNLSAAVYTELTDVMTETNGLLTYDRVPKVPLEKIRQINTFSFAPAAYDDVVPTSEAGGQEWLYTTSQPAGDAWQATGFDDSKWSKGKGAFGSHGDHVGMKWTSNDIWLRRHFNPGAVTPEQITKLVLKETHQGHLDIFINGVPTNVQRGNNRAYDARYEHRPISREARAAIRPNADNVIAIHAHGDGEKQYFDGGISVRK